MVAWIDAAPHQTRRGAVRRTVSRVALGAALGITLSAACGDDPESEPQFAAHCNSVDGDATCLQAYPSRPYCSLCFGLEDYQGCVATPPPPACVAGGGSAADGGGDDNDDAGTGGTDTGDVTSDSGGGDTVAADDTGTSDDTGTVEVPCDALGTRDPTCVESDPSRPFCIAGVCNDCVDAGGDSFCADLDVAAPACDVELGSCVPCNAVARSACDGLTPVCDQDAGVCTPCTEHADCEGTACHTAAADPLVGSCFAEDEVVWVDNAASCPGNGTEEDPLCSLSPAVTSVFAGEQWVIRLLPGTGYDEDIVFEQPAAVAIIGEGDPTIASSGAGEPTIQVGNDAVLYLSGVRVVDNPTEDGIECDSAVLSLDRTEVGNNGGWGMRNGGPCEVDVARSTLHNNAAGGVRMLGGHLELDNATVAANGDGLSGAGLVLVSAEIDAIYSTVAGNDAFGPDTLQCDGVTAGSIRNSILHGAENESSELACFMLEVENCAVDSAVFSGSGNVAVGGYQPGFFTDPSDGDFRLAAPPLTPYGDIAQWVDGDPPLDADGTERPVDVLGYAGIDQP